MLNPAEISLWQPVIGLEIHVELNTKSKLFSSAANHFGDEPNTNIGEVCTGQPGALPVLNKEAVRKAVQFGCAIGGHIPYFSRFDRKSYFYPDSPRNYQITQYDDPIVKGGNIVVDLHGEELSFAINRVHLEEDAGMLKHFVNFTGVDYNRAGVPLIEIVSEPCMHSAKEAVAYAMAIKNILRYIDVSDCNMEEGSLRIDANVSVRPKGSTELRNKIEIKNMNSFNFMEIALDYEILRQIKEYSAHSQTHFSKVISQATYRFDPDKKITVLMRRKEHSDDYRYFPEPDLVPLMLTDAYIEELRSTLPELPLQRKRRYLSELHLTPFSASLLTSDKQLADYFEEALKTCPNARALANWILVEFAGRLKESGKSIAETSISAQNLAELVNMIDKGAITGKIAKSVADDMLVYPHKSPAELVADNPNYNPMDNAVEIDAILETVLAQNKQSVDDFKAGKEKAFDFLIGQVMKHTRGKAAPRIVNDCLKKKLTDS